MEGRSLLRGGIFLLVLSVLRIGLDQFGAGGPTIPPAETELPDLLAESRETQDEEKRRSTPLGPGETLDPNRCEEAEFDRLPGIGPSTAAALVVYREENGGFIDADDLLRVPGIGPAKLGKVRRYLDFSNPMPLDLYRGGRSQPRLKAGLKVDPNQASSEELQSLNGIGPELAERIIQSRREEGPFRFTDDLLRVRGIGPILLSKIRDRLALGS